MEPSGYDNRVDQRDVAALAIKLATAVGDFGVANRGGARNLLGGLWAGRVAFSRPPAAAAPCSGDAEMLWRTTVSFRQVDCVGQDALIILGHPDTARQLTALARELSRRLGACPRVSDAGERSLCRYAASSTH